MILRLTDLDSGLEGWFFNPRKKIAYLCPKIDTGIAISLEVLHLLEYLLVSGNVRLEVTVLVFPFVLEGTELFFELSSASLGEAGSKESEPQLQVCSAEIAGLAELVNAGLSRGILCDDLEFGIAHGQIKKVFRRLQVMYGFEQLGVQPIGLDAMLVDRDDRASFYHGFVGIIEALSFVLVPEGYYMLSKHVGARGLAFSSNGLKIHFDVSEGLFWVFVVPLGPVLPLEVVIVLSLSSTLKV